MAVLEEPETESATVASNESAADDVTEESSLDDLYVQFDDLLVDGGREFETGDT